MSWSLVLTAAMEAATSEVEGAKKREERAAQKTMEQSGDSLTAKVPRENESKGNAIRMSEEKEKAFLRLWKTISGWSKNVLHDAVAFAKGHEPRDHETIERLKGVARKSEDSETDVVASKFAESVWPSLKSRGWNAKFVAEGDAAGRTRYVYNEKEVSGSLGVFSHYCYDLILTVLVSSLQLLKMFSRLHGSTTPSFQE